MTLRRAVQTAARPSQVAVAAPLAHEVLGSPGAALAEADRRTFLSQRAQNLAGNEPYGHSKPEAESVSLTARAVTPGVSWHFNKMRTDAISLARIGGVAGQQDRGVVSPSTVLGLQRTAGNAAASALIQCERAKSGAVLDPSRVLDVVGRGAGRPLSPGLRASMEDRFGTDFSAVRIHTDTKAAESAAAASARAYTVGDEIVFGHDAGGLESIDGKRTLAHELTHVVQQRRGAVAGTNIGGGVAVSDPSDAFEQQADATATQVMAEPTPIAHETGPAAVGLQRSCGEGCACAACQDPSRHTETTGSIETVSRLVVQRQDTCDPSVESCPTGTVDPNGNPNPGTPDQSAETPGGQSPTPTPSPAPNDSTVQGGQSVGPVSCAPPAYCPSDFCTPLPWLLAQSGRLDSFAAILAGIAAAVSPLVVPLWNKFIWGGVATVQDLSAQFGLFFTVDATTVSVTDFLADAMKSDLQANPPTFPPGGNTVQLTIDSTFGPQTAAALAAIRRPGDPHAMEFTGNSIPGNLAGGIGLNEAACSVGAIPSSQDDDRQAAGTAKITLFPNIGTLLVEPSINYTVVDTIDLCPGNCGTGFLTQSATTILSRWEATGISGDVPFIVNFPAPALASFTVTLASAAQQTQP